MTSGVGVAQALPFRLKGQPRQRVAPAPELNLRGRGAGEPPYTAWLIGGVLLGVALDGAALYVIAQVCRRIARRPHS